MQHVSRQQVEELAGYADQHDLSELVGAMVRMSPSALAELRSIIWLGRDGESPKHWDALVIEARSQVDDQTARFLAESADLGQNLRKGIDLLEASGRI